MRNALAVLGGLVTWIVVASLLHLPLKAAWPDYAAVVTSMHFTLAMMLARLLLGALATLAAGYVTAAIAPSSRDRPLPGTATALGVVLLLFFIPTHARIWSQLPPWYHLTFLGSLLPLTLLGARLRTARAPARARPLNPARTSADTPR